MTETRPRLHLHAGTHKTGTTAIQRFAADNRGALQRQGLLYPTYGPRIRTPNESHLAMFHAIAGEKSAVTETKVPKLLSRWWQTACKENLDVLLSAEAIWRHQISRGNNGWWAKRRAYLNSVSALLQGFDVHVHIVLRDQESFLTSSYREHVRKGTRAGSMPFVEFARRQLKTSLRYLDNLFLLERCIGNLHVSLYDELRRDPGLIDNFFSTLGIDPSDMPRQEYVRESLSIPQTLVKRYLNEHSALDNEDQLLLIENDACRAKIEDTLGHYSLWPSPRQRETFLARFEKENEEIRKRWFPNHDAILGASTYSRDHVGFNEMPRTLISELDAWGCFPGKRRFAQTASAHDQETR